MVTQELKNSSERIGQMYPILVDYHGNIIDGEHRLNTNKEWKKLRIPQIKTKKDLLVARLACNNIRRTVSGKEKTEILSQLGEILLNEGMSVGKITYELAHQTGMSYRWVAKYLPDRFKDGMKSSARASVAHHATKSITLKDPPKDALKLSAYSNINFVNFIMKKDLFTKLEEKAEKLQTNTTTLLYTAIISILTLS